MIQADRLIVVSRGARQGALTLMLVLAILGSWVPAQAASKAPYPAACRLPQADIHFSHLPTLTEFDGSQMQFARTDVNYYPRMLEGLSPSAASEMLPVEFPAQGAEMRFFYVQDNDNRYNEPTRLIGCLYFSKGVEFYVLSHAYGVEGNSIPIVVSLFSLNLERGIGNTLFVIVRWRIGGAGGSGVVYGLRAYGTRGITKLGNQNNWGGFELPDFVAKAFGANTWAISDSDDETVQSVHAYTNQAAIVKRLRQLGYVK